MSDKKDPVADFNAQMEVFKRKEEVEAKRLIVNERIVESQIRKIEENDRDLEILRNSSFGSLSPKQIEELKKANTDYIDSARTSMTFITDTFAGIIPYFRKNLILIGGKTGEGKSTTVANIAFQTIKQYRPDGKHRTVLVLTNEEKSEDVLNRITCLAHGWSYTNHNKFSDYQKDTFNNWIEILSKDGSVTVVDDNFNGGHGITTSIEGLCGIFDKLIEEKIYYDVVLIDYYQNFKYSKKDITLNEYEVQALVANALDKYKNVYPAPIVMMAQVNPPDEKNTPFQYRIKGRKVIVDVSTCILEMIAKREDYRTEWSIHKSRFNESIGKSFFTGFDKGLFVEYDSAFRTKVNTLKETRMFDKTSGQGLKEAMDKVEANNSETKPKEENGKE